MIILVSDGTDVLRASDIKYISDVLSKSLHYERRERIATAAMQGMLAAFKELGGIIELSKMCICNATSNLVGGLIC